MHAKWLFQQAGSYSDVLQKTPAMWKGASGKELPKQPSTHDLASARIYRFAIGDLSDEAIVKSFERLGRGGAHSYVRAQWVSMPTAVKYVGVIVHMEAFMSVISDHLAAVGYSVELHRALLQRNLTLAGVTIQATPP